MYKLLLLLFFSASLFAQNATYIPNTTIENHDINISIGISGVLDVTEKIEIQPRHLYDGMMVDNPLIGFLIPNVIHTKSAIRGISRNIDDFSVSLNGLPAVWEKKTFNKDEPNETLRIRLSPKYLTEVLTDEEKQTLAEMHKKYVYTLHYKVNKTVVEASKDGFDKIEWKLFHNPYHRVTKHAKINLFFPANLTKENFDNFDIHYTASTGAKQLYEWKNQQHFYAEIDNFRRDDLMFYITFPQGLLSQSASKNFDLVLNQNTVDIGKNEHSASYRWDTFLLYWHIPFFIFYFIILYYYARSYGSFAAMGSIVVRYETPNNMSLLQSGLLFNKSANIEDFPAAIVELASLGYLEILHNERDTSVLLKKIPKNTKNLSEDQRYLLNKILFSEQDIYYFTSQKDNLYQQFNTLNEKLHRYLEDKKYIYKNFEKTRKIFLFKAFLSALPILLFSLYVTKDLYGEKLMLGSIAGMYFLTVIIVLIIMRTGVLSALPFLITIYIIVGLPFVIESHSYVVLLSTPMLVMPFVYATMWLYYKKINIYTGKGLQAHRYLLGYKEFIKRTEAYKLKFVLQSHPDHIEKALAYVILFKLISYKLLPSYKHQHKILNNDTANESPLLFIGFWLFGIILFSILIFFGK